MRNRTLPFWIWSDDNDKDWSRKWSHFRKTFPTPRGAGRTTVICTSSGVYELFVNGTFAGSGDKWGLIRRHDITRFLAKDRNTIALRAMGGERLWFHAIRGNRSALVLELRTGAPFDPKHSVVSDGTWKTKVGDPPDGWTDLSFDDSGWENAHALSALGDDPTNEPARGIFNTWNIPTPEWTGDGKRPLAIPMDTIAGVVDVVGPEYVENLNETPPDRVFPVSIHATESAAGAAVKNPEHLLNDGDDACVFSGGTSSVILDFGKTLVGHIEVHAGAHSGVRIRTVSDFADDPRTLSPGSEYVIDDAVLKPGQASWRDPARRAFRYLRVEIEPRSESCAIARVFVRPTGFPVSNLGYFRCSDDLLNRVWRMGRNTLRLCMHHYFESEPRQERGYFTGDGRVDALVNFSCFADREVNRFSLDFWAAVRTLLNDMPSHYPIVGRSRDTHNTGLWDYLCWYVVCVHEHHLYTGEKEFVRAHFQRMRRAMEWLDRRCAANGLVYQVRLEYAGILDWSCGSVRLGETTLLNALFFRGLTCLAEMAGLLGKKTAARTYRKRAAAVRKAINRFLWSEERGAYIDYRSVMATSDHIPHDGNALAILFGVADATRARRALAYLKEHHWTATGSAMYDRSYAPGDPDYIPEGRVKPDGERFVAPFMEFHEIEARFERGDPADALELIRRTWGHMLSRGASTCWEYVPAGGWCHAWSTGPTHSLSARCLGVRPAEPGFRKIRIQPRLAGLEWVKGVVPTPRGPVAVSCRKENGRYVLDASIPPGCTAEVVLESGRRATIGPGRHTLGGKIQTTSAKSQ